MRGGERKGEEGSWRAGRLEEGLCSRGNTSIEGFEFQSSSKMMSVSQKQSHSIKTNQLKKKQPKRKKGQLLVLVPFCPSRVVSLCICCVLVSESPSPPPTLTCRRGLPSKVAQDVGVEVPERSVSHGGAALPLRRGALRRPLTSGSGF